MILNLLLLAVFAFGAGLFWVLTLRSHRREVPFGSRLGLPGSSVRRDPAVWDQAHAAATPLFLTATVVCLIQACAFGATIAYPDLLTWSYTCLLAGVGFALVALLVFLGVHAARQRSR